VEECEGSVLITASSKDDLEDICDSLYELHNGKSSCIGSKDSKGQSVITEFPVSRSMRVFQEKRAVIFGGGMALASFLNAIIVPHSSSIMFAASAFGLVFYLCCTLFISGSDLAMMDFGHSRQSILKTMRKTLLVCFAVGFICALVCCLSDPMHSLSVLFPFAVAMPISVLMLRIIIDKRIPFGLYANIATYILLATTVLGLGILGDNLVLPTVLNDSWIVSVAYAVSIVSTLMIMKITEKNYIHSYLTIERPPVRTPRQWKKK